jgi:hypothetical protein
LRDRDVREAGQRERFLRAFRFSGVLVTTLGHDTDLQHVGFDFTAVIDPGLEDGAADSTVPKDLQSWFVL